MNKYFTTSQADFNNANSWTVVEWDGNTSTVVYSGLSLVEASDAAAEMNAA